MRSLRLFGAALTVCAIGALLASSAFALPTILPGAEEKGVTWTGKSIGKVELFKASGAKIRCESGAAEGVVEAKKASGPYHSIARECTESAFGTVCTGTGDEAGTLLESGTWSLVYDTLAASLSGSGVAILTLVSTVKFTCAFGSSFELKAGGMVLCLVLNPTTLTKTFEFHCNRTRGSSPEETKYYNASGTLVSITPTEVSENGGAFEETIGVDLATIGLPQDELIMI
jgi:hypothetical protein